MSATFDLKTVQKEFASVSKTIAELEMQLSKQKAIYVALFRLIEALGGNPKKHAAAADDAESDKAPQTLPLGLPTTLPEVLKEAIPPAGLEFGIDDVIPSVRQSYPTIVRDEISNVLWRLCKEGFLERINKGSRGNPARYARL